jgi:hypothetical protein
LARVFVGISRYPTNVSDLPTRYGIMLLEAGTKFLRIKKLDAVLTIQLPLLRHLTYMEAGVGGIASALALTEECISALQRKEREQK